MPHGLDNLRWKGYAPAVRWTRVGNPLAGDDWLPFILELSEAAHGYILEHFAGEVVSWRGLAVELSRGSSGGKMNAEVRAQVHDEHAGTKDLPKNSTWCRSS